MDETYNDLYPLQLKDPEIPDQEDCSSDTVPAGTTNMEGKKKVLVPELITMTKVLFDRHRLDMYTYLNNCLHTGGLTAIVGKPIKTRVINHEICIFPGVNYWRIDRANFFADVTVELKLQTSTGLVDWRGCLTCWCGFDDNGLFVSIEDLDEPVDRKDEGLDMLSPYLVPYATNKRVDEISEALWKKYLPEALDDPKQRIAAELVKRMGLTIEFHPVYEHRNVESIIFFKKDELAIGEDRKEKDANGKERHIKARFGKPVVIPANTIVINTNKIHRDYSAFNIYHECYHYETQLKDVEKLLKLDPSNTELVRQKQQLLAQAIKDTKEKLATLKTAAEQANEQLQKGEITQQQYDALQREIQETEQQLKSLESQASTTNATLAKIEEVGGKFQQVGEKISSVGKTLTTHVTAPIVGLGTAAVKTAADFDEGMSKVAAISGVTGGDLQDLRDKAREMGAKTKFSATEAASAFEYMAMAGWKTGDMMDGIEGIMNLAAASGEDLATTSDIVTDALTAFGLKAEDSGHFADILAAASSNANTNVSMMGETFKYAAPIAGALGFSAEDTAEAIGLMANAGIKGSQAGTSLRTIMNNLAGEVKIAGKNIGEVTIQTSNADGSMRDLSDILADCRVAFSGLSESEAAAAAESLVGKNAMSGFLALMNAASEDIDKLSSAIENCDGTAESMAATMQDNLKGQLTILKSQLEELAISFGELLMPAIRAVVSKVQAFVDKLNNMSEAQKKTILKVAALAAAIGPLLVVLGKTVSTVGSAMKGFTKIAKSSKVLVASVRELASSVGGAFTGLSLPEISAGQLAMAGAGGGSVVNNTRSIGSLQVVVNGYNARNDNDLADTVVQRINEMLNEDDKVWGR